VHGMRPDGDDIAGDHGRRLTHDDVDGDGYRDHDGGNDRRHDDVAGAFGELFAARGIVQLVGGFLMEETLSAIRAA
jgi:hypothetical protein